MGEAFMCNVKDCKEQLRWSGMPKWIPIKRKLRATCKSCGNVVCKGCTSRAFEDKENICIDCINDNPPRLQLCVEWEDTLEKGSKPLVTEYTRPEDSYDSTFSFTNVAGNSL